MNRTVTINGRTIELTNTPTVSMKRKGFQILHARNSRIMKDWVNSIDSKFIIESIEIECVDYRGVDQCADNVMFIRMQVKTADKRFKQIVELRGGTCVMLPIINCGCRQFTILVVQNRLATGDSKMEELPAGMVDNGNFHGAAVKEIQEETGFTITKEDLIELTKYLPGKDEREIYFSSGLLDEKAKFYSFEVDLSRDELEALQGKHTGAVEEDESITLHVIPLNDVIKYSRDMKTFVALYLHDLREKNRKRHAGIR